jgi:hypothetical protein
MRRSLLLSILTATALVTSLGCQGHGATDTTKTPAAEPAAPERPARASRPEAPLETPLAIGWAEIPGEPDPKARDYHREGLVHLNAGHLEDAVARFQHAVVLDPGFAWARFDLARALSLGGHEAEAVTEMQRLVIEDLPTYGPRWAAEQDLAAARASAEGQRLDARLPAIRDAYREAIASGVPAMTYLPRKPLDAKRQPQTPHEELRLGVYLPSPRRFVPAVPHVPGALAGYLDRQADRAIVLAGDVVMGELWVVQARGLDVAVFDLDDPGRVVVQASDIDELNAETDQPRVAVRAAVEGDDARITLEQLRYAPESTVSLRVTTDGVELTREHVSAALPHVHVDANGGFVDVPPPAGLSIEGRQLRVHDRRDPFQLGAGHDAAGHPYVARTIDDRWAIVFTELAGCKEAAYTTHVLDRVDIERGEVVRLHAAAKHAGVALGPDGSVYLDAEGHVIRYAPGSKKPVADVLPGVRFTLPDYDRDCSN